MKGYDLGWFCNGKAFIHFDGVGKCNKFTYGPRICINTKGEILFELPDRDMIVWNYEEEDIAFIAGGEKQKRLYAVMDNKGNFLTDFIYNHIYGGSEEGMFEVNRDGKHGHIDITGKEVIPCIYDTGRHFSEGVAAECLNGRYGMIDVRNEIIIPFEYENICTCKNNVISAQKDGKWGLINKNNEIIVDFIYDDIYNWCTRECLVYPACKNGKWGLIDRYGNIIEDFIYDEIDVVSVDEDNAGEFIQVIKNKRRAIYSTKRKMFITDFEYNYFGYLSDNRLLAHKGNKIGFLDTCGEVVIPFVYDNYNHFYEEDFSEGLCVVYKDDKAGMIDSEGNIIIPFEYKKLGSCTEGMIWAEDFKDKSGYFNRKGEITIPFGRFYCYHNGFHYGFAIVSDEEQGKVFINKTGEILEIKI